MGKTIFTISYDVIPEKRSDYLDLAHEMTDHLTRVRGKNYSIYEQKGKPNSFSEVFICNTSQEYDQLEDDQDERTEQLINRLEEYLVSGKMRYSTMVEID